MRCETCEEEYRGAECPHQFEHDAWELEKSDAGFLKLATGALKDFLDTISRDNPDIGPVDVTTQVNIRFNELTDATAALRAELEKAKADALDALDFARLERDDAQKVAYDCAQYAMTVGPAQIVSPAILTALSYKKG
jgi:hypothetical protein